jgi:hypothetical protein
MPEGQHIAYWNQGAWRPWCVVMRNLMPEERPVPRSPEICPGCFALAVEELEEAQDPRPDV